jgi:hypothetical protein
VLRLSRIKLLVRIATLQPFVRSGFRRYALTKCSRTKDQSVSPRTMERPQKPRTTYFSRLLKPKHAASGSPQNPPTTTVPQSAEIFRNDISGRKETKERFINAATFLQESLKLWQEDSENSLDFPELAGEPETFDLQFRKKLNLILDSRKESIKDKSTWSKFGDTIVGIFTALSPFAKNFLSVAREGQSVKYPAAVSERSRYRCLILMDYSVVVFLS